VFTSAAALRVTTRHQAHQHCRCRLTTPFSSRCTAPLLARCLACFPTGPRRAGRPTPPSTGSACLVRGCALRSWVSLGGARCDAALVRTVAVVGRQVQAAGAASRVCRLASRRRGCSFPAASMHAARVMTKQRGGLIVNVSFVPAADGGGPADQYLGNLFYDLSKAALNRRAAAAAPAGCPDACSSCHCRWSAALCFTPGPCRSSFIPGLFVPACHLPLPCRRRLAFGLATDLRPHGVAAVALSPGHLRTERVLQVRPLLLGCSALAKKLLCWRCSAKRLQRRQHQSLTSACSPAQTAILTPTPTPTHLLSDLRSH
jgi:hypothetical protein